MSPALEYILRTGVIEGLLQIPNSLYLENKLGRLVVTIDGSDDECYVRHWDIDKCGKFEFPTYKEFTLPRSRLFVDDATVVPGFLPIQYLENPVQTCLNSYNHPMENIIFQDHVSRFLNSERHIKQCYSWLWRSFLKTQLDHIEKTNKDSTEFEQEYIRTCNCKLWALWKEWIRAFQKKERVAAELVFLSAYKRKNGPKVQLRFRWDQ